MHQGDGKLCRAGLQRASRRRRKTQRRRLVGLLRAALVLLIVVPTSPVWAEDYGDANLAEPPTGIVNTGLTCREQTLENANGAPALVAKICIQSWRELSGDRMHLSARLINKSPSVPFYIVSTSISDTGNVGEYVDFCSYKSWLFPGKNVQCSGNSARGWAQSGTKVIGRFTYHRQPDGALKTAEFVY